MNIGDLALAMEQVAPTGLAEPWDNVGLLCGDPAAGVTGVLLTIDYVAPVAAEARRLGCQAVIAYHPPVFDPLKKLVAGELVYDAIRDGIALYSPHTALDMAEGGTNDVLADVLGLRDRRPLSPRKAAAPWHYKVVTFIPPEHVDRLATAMFEAGAGWVGRYSHCSYRVAGTGTFLPHAGARPAVGEVGRLEQTPEIRIEMIVPSGNLEAVVAALRASHPYEEPAFDIVQLTSPPPGIGLGRIGETTGTSRSELLARIREGLSVGHLLIAGPTDGVVSVAACAAGSCGPLYAQAAAQGAGLYLTGELKHHDAIKAAATGMTVVCVLHSNSERVALQHLARRLSLAMPGVEFHVSQADRDPFTIA